MSVRRRVWVILAAAYVTATAAIQLLWGGGAALTADAVGRAAVVIAVQIGALEIAARIAGLYRRDRRGDDVAGFLVLWVCLACAFGVATLAFDLLIRRIDLTSLVVLSLMAVPSVQAWAVIAGLGRGDVPGAGWQAFVHHPLARPVLLLDTVMLGLGLLLPNHPLVGLAAVGLVQRRWAGTKFIAAALILGAVALRPPTPDQPGRSRPRLALAAALAALGVETFVPWLFALSSRLPSPLSAQPPSFLWLEVYGTAAALVLTFTILVRRSSSGRASVAHAPLGFGAIALFIATLAILMNGFLSLDPVSPWASIVLIAASTAASCYTGAALLLSSVGSSAVAHPPAAGD